MRRRGLFCGKPFGLQIWDRGLEIVPRARLEPTDEHTSSRNLKERRRGDLGSTDSTGQRHCEESGLGDEWLYGAPRS